MGDRRKIKQQPAMLSSIEGIMPPQATDFEEAVLGALLLEGGLNEIISILEPQSFYKDAHIRIFTAILALFSRSEPVDMLTVTQELKKSGELDIVGGAYYITQLTNKVAGAANIEFHARIIQQKFIQREVIRISSQNIQNSYDDGCDIFDLLEISERELFKITQKTYKKEPKTASKLSKDVLDRLELLMKRKDGLSGIPSGIQSLDKILGGWQDSDLIIIAARPAMGKCLGKGTKILMFDGSLKKVEEINIGDKLMGVNSTERNVLSICTGKEMMYWVKQNKGINYRVNESHVLSLRKSGEKNSGEITNIPILDYFKKSKRFRTRQKGYKVDVEFIEQKIILDPYFLGLWLGDGSTNKVEITNPEPEIEIFLNEYAKLLKLQVTKYIDNRSKCPSYSITKGYRGKKNEYCLKIVMNELNLIGNKHIPNNYLINSKQNRLQLLAGLLDTDGYYDKKCNGFEITQIKKELAEQIKFLCDTLGFKTSLNKVNTSIKKINFKGVAYRVRIFGNIHEIPTRVNRKKAIFRKRRTDWKVTGITVEKDKVDDYFGFEIDGDKLFLLEDCTVTHNTALAATIAVNCAVMFKIPVAFFSLEMSDLQIMNRILSFEAEVDGNKFKSPKSIQEDEWKRINRAINDVSNSPLFIDDTPSLSILELKAKARRLKAKNDIKLIVIDYLQLMTAPSENKQNREQEISYISRNLKALAKDLNIPVIALSQLSRASETRGGEKRPMLSDLRESGAIEQDADIVIFPHRPEYYGIIEDKVGNSLIGKAELIVSKHRSGSTDTALTEYIAQFTKFMDINTLDNFSPKMQPNYTFSESKNDDPF